MRGGASAGPHVLHLRPYQLPVSTHGHPTDIIFLDLQNSIPLFLFWNFTGHCTQQKMANAQQKPYILKLFIENISFFVLCQIFTLTENLCKKRTKYEPALRILHFFSKKVLKSLIKVTSMKSFKFY